MKKLFLFSLLNLLFLSLAFGQTDVEPIKYQPEVMPEFVGGSEAMAAFMVKNMKYPEAAQKAGTVGTIYVQFTIEKDGKVSEATVLRGGDPLLVAEALRVINSMPNWKPGQHEGKTVRTSMALPVKFEL